MRRWFLAGLSIWAVLVVGWFLAGLRIEARWEAPIGPALSDPLQAEPLRADEAEVTSAR